MKQYISDEQIASVMTTRDFVESCDEAFRLYGLGKMVNPLRKEEVSREGEMDLFRLVMPGWWKGRFTGQKVIEERSDVKMGRLGSRTAVIELEDVRRDDRITLDAERITNMRTGAAGALGAKYLAESPVRTAAILGTGRIAQALGRCIDVALAPETYTCNEQDGRETCGICKQMLEGIFPVIWRWSRILRPVLMGQTPFLLLCQRLSRFYTMWKVMCIFL